MLHTVQAIFHNSISLTAHVLELMGVIVILFGAARDFIRYFTGRAVDVRLDLARSLALGLEFKLGGEILRTVIVRELSELLLAGAIVLLRAALSLLIHWEIGHLEEAEKGRMQLD